MKRFLARWPLGRLVLVYLVGVVLGLLVERTLDPLELAWVALRWTTAYVLWDEVGRIIRRRLRRRRIPAEHAGTSSVRLVTLGARPAQVSQVLREFGAVDWKERWLSSVDLPVVVIDEISSVRAYELVGRLTQAGARAEHVL